MIHAAGIYPRFTKDGGHARGVEPLFMKQLEGSPEQLVARLGGLRLNEHSTMLSDRSNSVNRMRGRSGPHSYGSRIKPWEWPDESMIVPVTSPTSFKLRGSVY